MSHRLPNKIPRDRSCAAAQLTVERTATVTVGVRVSAGLPADLYDGRVALDRRRGWKSSPYPDPLVQTRYGERLHQPVALCAELSLGSRIRQLVALRGVLGHSSSTASYQGGTDEPAHFRRQVSWSGLNLLGGIVLRPGIELDVSGRSGEKRVSVSVTDLLSGNTVTATRRLGGHNVRGALAAWPARAVAEHPF